MVKHGDIPPEAARLAKAETLQYAAAAFPIEAPHFVFYVRNLLEQQYGPDVLNSGLTVQTTQNEIIEVKLQETDPSEQVLLVEKVLA